MNHVACDVCSADDAVEVYRARSGPGTLHERYVRCRSCGLVYADPRADPREAERFYSGSHGGAEASAPLAQRDWDAAVAGRRSHLADLAPPAEGAVRFADIGFGDGASLAAAVELGWDATGLELDPNLVDAARARVPEADVILGDVTSFDPSEPFDVVYSWHTIEHVLDVDAWVAAIRRIMRPGGTLVVGTENAASAYARLYALPDRMRGRVPRPPTSTEHTYWFEGRHLERLLARNAFADIAVRAYENSPLAIARALPTWRPFTPTVLASKAIYLASAVVAVARPQLGGKLVVRATAGPRS